MLQLVKEVVKRPLQIKGDEVSRPGARPGARPGKSPGVPESFLVLLPISCGPEATTGFSGCSEGLSLCLEEASRVPVLFRDGS